LLGWVAGDIMIKDSALEPWLGAALMDRLHYWAAVAGAAFVVGCGYLIRRMRHKEPLEHPLVIDPPGPEEFPHKRAESQPARDRA
jgi:hypothetical protein